MLNLWSICHQRKSDIDWAYKSGVVYKAWVHNSTSEEKQCMGKSVLYSQRKLIFFIEFQNFTINLSFCHYMHKPSGITGGVLCRDECWETGFLKNALQHSYMLISAFQLCICFGAIILDLDLYRSWRSLKILPRIKKLWKISKKIHSFNSICIFKAMSSQIKHWSLVIFV